LPAFLRVDRLEHATSRILARGTCEKALRYQCTTQRCQAACGNTSPAASTKPRQASETISRTPARPRCLSCLRNANQLAPSSLPPSQMPRISR
jgi:hypothetical protein